jgi:hypothetical protein
MITKFNTTSIGSPSAGGKSSNTLIYILVGAVALYLGYKYVIQPQMEKEQKQD